MNKTFLGKRVLVYGMGTSGQAACKLLHTLGACVSFYDDQERFGSFFGYEKNPITKQYDVVVVSPGIKVNGNEIISHFLLNKTQVISELDLGYMYCQGKVIGITGTNGKTTTTMLVGAILKEAGLPTFVCGNVGLPISSIALQTTKSCVVDCEVSNFQLELSSCFHADVACILNLAPDHLDRHGSYEEYVRVKKKIIASRGQKLILNVDDEQVRSLKISKKNLYFSKKTLNKGVFIKNNAIYFNKLRIMSVSDIPLIGEKNLENVLAATAIACALHIKPKFIKSAILNFTPPPHRLQYLGKIAGADVIDDSKATNISSVESAVESLQHRPIILLMGGLNKDCDFDPFFQKGYTIDTLICFGQAGKYLADCAKRFGYSPSCFSTLREATKYAAGIAESGKLILLSPGCASFDEFASYAVRGEMFKEMLFETEPTDLEK